MDGSPTDRVAAAVRARIDTGDLGPGDRAPSVRELVADHGVAMSTAARALGRLREEGLLRTTPRVGSVVAGRSEPPASDRPPDAAGLVRTAIGIADDEGLAALSMRRLAGAFGVPTMSLYRLVRSRDELLLAMIEAVFAELVLPPAGGSWRDRVEGAAHAQWRVHRRHPWLARVLSLSRPQALPSLLRFADFELAALEEVVADPVERFDVHLALTAFVRGMALTLAAEQEAQADTGVDADTWSAHDPGLRAALHRHGGPALRRVGDYPYDLQRVLDTGIARFLDGIS
ncbi:GntR family transcriptional regulator [Pseudonocardia sp. ICBG1293]|uniref:GntR family transcriptional regulator n=1 Tax=Pseudonocardia sp. ICBG1293 TaxID=2844382 RepID=UPI001CCE9FE4|nr:GntR family transcriptional regulator [Pseudonocardia sp. ICBG1293]